MEGCETAVCRWVIAPGLRIQPRNCTVRIWKLARLNSADVTASSVYGRTEFNRFLAIKCLISRGQMVIFLICFQRDCFVRLYFKYIKYHSASMPLARRFPLFCVFKSLLLFFIIEGMTKLVCWFEFVVKIVFLGIRTALSWAMAARECLRLFGIFWTLYMAGCWLLCRECSRESNVLLESNLIDNLGLC